MNIPTNLTTANWGRVKNERYEIALLPWGATEPHNYHLPYTTDSILSSAIANDAAICATKMGTTTMVLPSITLGSQNPGQRELSFCLHARYETQVAILRDIVSSLTYQGINKLLIVNGHGGNSFKNMIRDILVDFPHFVIASCQWYEMVNANAYFENMGEHADEAETSTMMHYHPELVELSNAGDGESRNPQLKPLAEGLIWMPRNWNEISTDTGIGNPHLSTAAKGENFAKACVEKMADVIVEMCK